MTARALLSVSDKRGIVDLARELIARGWEVVSTGGTAETLRQAGVSAIPIEQVTGFPEMMDGRVKTLHPKVHGGLLARRAHPGDRAALAEHGITPIDLVVVNLYPFRETVAKPGVAFEQALEQIDIGGPSMLRSAAKNHHDVFVVVDPDDYPRVVATRPGGPSASRSRWSASRSCATGRTRTRPRRSTRRRSPASATWSSCPAKSCRSTTCWTWTRVSWRSRRGALGPGIAPHAPSSSTPRRVASPWAARPARRTSAPSPRIARPRSDR